MTTKATDPSRQRYARANAVLLRLECETSLAPAAAEGGPLAFLEEPVRALMALRLDDSPHTGGPDPEALAQALEQATEKANAILPHPNAENYRSRRELLNVLARCARRARKLANGAEEPQREDSAAAP